MNTEILFNQDGIRVEQVRPLVASGFVGKAKKPAFTYRFRDQAQQDQYIAKWIAETKERLARREAYKAEKKANRAAQREARVRNLADNLKVGTFLKNVWGATMRRVNWFEVVSIEGNPKSIKSVRLGLRVANYSDNSGGYDGMSKLLGPGTGEATSYAVLREGYIVKEGSSLTDHWSTLEITQIGDSEHVFSD